MRMTRRGWLRMTQDDQYIYIVLVARLVGRERKAFILEMPRVEGVQTLNLRMCFRVSNLHVGFQAPDANGAPRQHCEAKLSTSIPWNLSNEIFVREHERNIIKQILIQKYGKLKMVQKFFRLLSACRKHLATVTEAGVFVECPGWLANDADSSYSSYSILCFVL